VTLDGDVLGEDRSEKITMKMFGLKTLILAALLSVGSVAHAEIIDRIMARVNSEIITLHDVRQAAIPFLLQNGFDPQLMEDPKQRPAILQRTLDDLVERQLLAQEARKIDYKIGDDELDKWLEFTRSQQNLSEEAFKQTIEQYGMPYSAYREMVRANLLKVRMVNIKVGSQVMITDDDVDSMYREKYGESGDRVSYRTIAHILVRPAEDTREAKRAVVDRLRKLKSRIDAGEDFGEIAAAENQGPAADNKGLLGTYRQSDLDPSFALPAFSLEVGAVSEPVETPFGFHLIKVLSEEKRANPEVEQRRELIRGELRQSELERLLKQYMSQLKTRSFVETRSF